MTVFCSTVVSLASRLVSSPVRVESKKPISDWRIAPKRSVRSLATTRSPATVNSHARTMPATAWSANRPTRASARPSTADRSSAFATTSTSRPTIIG